MDGIQPEDGRITDSNESEDGCMVKAQLDEYENRPFECILCGNRFNRSAHLKSHLTVHTGERAYTCSECGDKFKQSSALNTHMLIHTGDRPYPCKWCGKSFRTSSTLKKHSFLHTGERPYSCDICGRSFTQLPALKSHIFTHRPESERPFHCNSCNRGFVNKSIFKFHQLKCRGEHRNCERRNYTHFPPLDENLFIECGFKQYECTFCKKQFKCKSTLRIHLRVHTGERPYKCDLCDRAFAQSNDLKVHFYLHSGERPHKCPLCEKAYTNKGTLNQHLRRHERRVDGSKQSKRRSATHRVKLSKATKSRTKKKLKEDSITKNYNDTITVLDLRNKKRISSGSEVSHDEDSKETLLNNKCNPKVDVKRVVDVTPKEQKDSLSLDTVVGEKEFVFCKCEVNDDNALRQANRDLDSEVNENKV